MTSFTYLIVIIGAFIVLLSSSIVTDSVFKNIDKIGSDDDLKKQITSRTLFNYYAVTSLFIVMIARTMNLIDLQLFIAFFTTILIGLGIKVTRDYLSSERTK